MIEVYVIPATAYDGFYPCPLKAFSLALLISAWGTENVDSLSHTLSISIIYFVCWQVLEGTNNFGQTQAMLIPIILIFS